MRQVQPVERSAVVACAAYNLGVALSALPEALLKELHISGAAEWCFEAATDTALRDLGATHPVSHALRDPILEDVGKARAGPTEPETRAPHATDTTAGHVRSPYVSGSRCAVAGPPAAPRAPRPLRARPECRRLDLWRRLATLYAHRSAGGAPGEARAKP